MRTPDQIIEEYLKQVEAHLGAVPRAQRREFLAEVRSHLEEQIGPPESASSLDVLNALERFGDPEDVAREFAQQTSPSKASQGRHSNPPSWLVVALTVLVWPVGIILAWLSPAWTVRDKAIATLIPILALGLLGMGGLTFSATGPTQVSEHILPLEGDHPWEILDDQELDRLGLSQPSPWAHLQARLSNIFTVLGMVVIPLLVGSPALSGLYLALRRLPGY